MILELEQSSIAQGLFQELGFADYLALFDAEIPLLPRKILRSLNKKQALTHFNQLSELHELIEQNKINLVELLELSSQLPLLDDLLPLFENKCLEQFHLFQLRKFVVESEKLFKGEAAAPLADKSGTCCKNIEDILKRHTVDQSRALKLSPDEARLEALAASLDQRLKEEISAVEQVIERETGLKMLYPFPRELPYDAADLAKLKNCKHLHLSSQHDLLLAELILPQSAEKLAAEKDQISEEFAELIQQKLKVINHELSPYSKEFQLYYQTRKERTLLYVLLRALVQFKLCLPQFSDEKRCRFEKLRLPVLEANIDRYVALDIDLNSGANVLFGANLTGKTTVLKTIYFALACTRAGLPLPAEKALLHFPQKLEIHLKSSGDIRSNTSSFSEELEFFTVEFSPGDYVLVDELFQSTDPVSGTELSRIFLSEFAEKNVLFFCTSQYPDILSLPNINLFKMLDRFDYNLKKGQKQTAMMGETPYRMEQIDSAKVASALQESQKPLYIALDFALPPAIKKRIADFLDSKKKSTGKRD